MLLPKACLWVFQLLSCHAANDAVLDFFFTEFTGVICLQLCPNALQESLEEVLGGRVHHLGLDATAIRSPGNKTSHGRQVYIETAGPEAQPECSAI